jgi:hypothetical protein
MHTFKRLTLSLALSAAAFTSACGDDGSDTETNDTSTSPSAPMTDPGTTAPEPTTGGPTTVDPTPGDPTNDPTTEDPTTEDPNDPFVFDQTPPGDLVQLDRMGMPAVATAVISKEQKDAYNEADPAVDAASTFVPDIIANVTALHTALDDDLTGLGLTPCAAADCVAQAGPLVVPDTLKIDVSKPAGFPNGRRLEDPVIDITLAVVMLDLGTHAADTFAKLPVNPPKNDKDFLPDFPYVAPPN